MPSSPQTSSRKRREAQLTAVRASVARHIADHEHGAFLRSQESIDEVIGAMVVQLDRYVYGVDCHKQVVTYPADWRSHFNRDVVIPLMTGFVNASTKWGPWRRWLRRLIGHVWVEAVRRHWFDVEEARVEISVRAAYPEMRHIPRELGQPFMVASSVQLPPVTWSPDAPLPPEGPQCRTCGREVEGDGWCPHCDERDDVRDDQGALRHRCEGSGPDGRRCREPSARGTGWRLCYGHLQGGAGR